MDIYSPGHYCLLLVDGRQETSRGMFLDEMSQLFEQLGCKVAYNLDGGHCSFLTFQGKIANHPYKPEHAVADGLFIAMILDWFNPFMDFSGHMAAVRMVLYVAVIILAITKLRD